MENHTVMIDNRETITVTDIKEIDSFDEDEVRATLSKGSNDSERFQTPYSDVGS